MVEPRPGSRDFLFIKRDNPGNIIGATITLLKQLETHLNRSYRAVHFQGLRLEADSHHLQE